MSYADYFFYKNVYMGDMNENDFSVYSQKASISIDVSTQYRAVTAPQSMQANLKLACCNLSDLIKAEDEFNAMTKYGSVQSEHNDGYILTFSDKTSSEITNFSQRRKDIFNTYLTHPCNLMARWL